MELLSKELNIPRIVKSMRLHPQVLEVISNESQRLNLSFSATIEEIVLRYKKSQEGER